MCVPVSTNLTRPGPFRDVFSLPCVLPVGVRRQQASHPEQHQHLQVLPEHRHRGAERALQQAVCPLQVVAVPEDEDRVEVQRVPGPVPDSGERGLGVRDSERRAGLSRGEGGRLACETGGCRPRGETPCREVLFEARALAAPSAVSGRRHCSSPNGSWPLNTSSHCAETRRDAGSVVFSMHGRCGKLSRAKGACEKYK